MNYTIKQISELTGASERSLRNYDEMGLLVPSRDEDNNYRL